MGRRVWRICGLAVVTALFILGNCLAADGLFKNMENRLLSDMGSVEMETAVELADVQNTNSNETTDATITVTEKEGRFSPELTEEEMAEILTCWKYSGGEVIHEPMEGQISMEAAIENAKMWVWEMLKNGALPEILFYLVSDDGKELLFDSVVAVLIASDTDSETTKLAKAYYSFWEVTFSCDYGFIDLTVNAVTGQVWYANMQIIGEFEKIYMQPDQTGLWNFARLAGMNVDGACCFEPSDMGGILIWETGTIYAKGNYTFWQDCSLNDYSAFEYGKKAEAYGMDIASCQLQYTLRSAQDGLTKSTAENIEGY